MFFLIQISIGMPKTKNSKAVFQKLSFPQKNINLFAEIFSQGEKE